MSRVTALAIISLMCVFTSTAQVQIKPSAGTSQPPSLSKPLIGEDMLRWVCGKLELTSQQKKQSEALFVLYQADVDEAKADRINLLRRMQVVMAEIDQAKADGDTERERELRGKLSKMGPESSAEDNFFEKLAQILTDEQKTKLPKLRNDVKTAHLTLPAPKPAVSPQPVPVPEGPPVAPVTLGALRPSHVLKAVNQLGLAPEQQKQFEEILEQFRTNMRVSQPRTEEALAERLDQFIKMIRPILPADLGGAFDLALVKLRSNPPAAKPFVRPVSPRPDAAEVKMEDMPEIMERTREVQGKKQ